MRLHLRNTSKRAVLLGLRLVLCGWPVYRPHAAVDPNSFPQLRSQSDGQVRVSAAVLSAEETRKIFGVPVYDSGVQPVWLSIENHDHVPCAFFSVSVDPDRFSPEEAAYRNHYQLFLLANGTMNAYFLRNAMGQTIPPGKTVSGFVYANEDLEAKYVQVQLVGPKGTQLKLLRFLLPVPGPGTHYKAARVSELYSPEEITSYDEKGFRQALERMPGCSTNDDGTIDGDPINIVFVGEMDEILSALLDRQWNLTEEVDLGSVWMGTKAFPFRHASASPRYFYGRHQDVTIQSQERRLKREITCAYGSQRCFESKPVWVGQVSRDIGVRFTLDTWNLATHRIDSSC